MALALFNGFVLGIVHEGYPEVDAWCITIYLGPLAIMFGRNILFDDEEE